MAFVTTTGIREIWTGSGTGTIALGGAATGSAACSTAMANGDTSNFLITDGTVWEASLCTYATSTNSLTRTTVLANSAGTTSLMAFGSTSNKAVVLTGSATGNATLSASTMPIITGTIYVATTGGDDTRSLTQAHSSATPWKTLGKVNNCALAPGATILLNAGDTFTQAFLPMGGGSSGSPVTLSSYGTGNKPKIRAATQLPSTGWATVRANVYSIAAPKPVTLPGSALPGFPATAALCVFWDNSLMNPVASAALVANPGDCFWGGGTLTLWSYTSDSPNTGSHIYRVCASNIASPDPTYGGHVGIETRYDHFKIDGIDVAWAGHACIGQGYNQTRYTLDHDVRNCIVATGCFAAVMVTCDNTAGSALFFANSIDQSGAGNGFGIVAIDPNLGWIKNVTITGNTTTNCGFGIAIGGTCSTMSISGNTVVQCTPGIAAISDIGLGTQYKPTSIAVTGNTLSADLNPIMIQIENTGQSFGANCIFSGNTISGGQSGIFLDGDTSGSSTSGFLVERNIISDTSGDGIFLGSNATGVKVHDNLITGCGRFFVGSSSGLHVKRGANSIEVFNNTLDQNQVGVWIESSGSGSGSHNLANNTVSTSVAQDFLIADATQLAASHNNNAFGGGTPGYNGAYTGLAAWQAAGFEAGSLSVSPAFVGPIVTAPGTGVLATATGYALTAASPLRSAGAATTLTTDFFGTTFHTPPAIGFYSNPLFAASSSYPGAISWTAATTARQAAPVALGASRLGSARPALEVLARITKSGNGNPLAFEASPVAAVPLPAALSAGSTSAASLAGAHVSTSLRASPMPSEWQRTTIGTAAARAPLPLDWSAGTTGGAIAPTEATAANLTGLPQPTEWGLASVSPSAIGTATSPLDWRTGQTTAIPAPIECLASAGAVSGLRSEWIAPARGGLITSPVAMTGVQRGATLTATIEYRADQAQTGLAAVAWNVGATGQPILFPIAWEGHATVTQAIALPTAWLSRSAGFEASGTVEVLQSSGVLSRFAAECLAVLAGSGPSLPIEIGAAPFIGPAISPALRVGLYAFAMKGLHGLYMLGGVLARDNVAPVTVTVGTVRSQGSAESFNRAVAAPRIGPPINQGAFGGIDVGAGRATVGPSTLRANAVLIFPNMAAGMSDVGALVNHGTLFLVPPIQFAGAAKADAAIARGTLAGLNSGAGVATTLPAIAGATAQNIQPDRLVGFSQTGAALVTGTGDQTNLGVGSQQAGAMNLSGALSSLDELSGSLTIDVNGPLIGGGTASFTIGTGGASLSTVNFVDIGAGSAVNSVAGASLLGAATMRAVIVITTFNHLVATLSAGAAVSGATLFTEQLAITLPSAAQGVPIALSGTYIGGPPTALSSSFDGVTWTPLTNLAIGAGAWSGTAPALAAAGPATIQVRDAVHTGISATSASFTVASSAPAAPTALAASGAATASTSMHGFFAADPDENGNSPTGRVLTVGAGGGFQYTTVAAALAASLDGDTIQVQSGTYTDDTAFIRTSVTLTAAGGRVDMYAPTDLANQKGILICGTATLAPTVTINGFNFHGAFTTNGANGAGIRYQNGFLTVTNCYFHDNENGILADAQSLGTIFIDHCEFNHNGNGNALSHNMYIGIIKQFTLQNSYSHDCVVGHEVKSRALSSTITNNRIFDNNGTASYSIDLPQGGNALITGNIIQKGVNSKNTALIAYNEEVATNAGTSFQVSGNTLINDETWSAPKAVWNQTSLTPPVNAALSNNKFWGLTSTQIVVSSSGGTSTQVGNTFLAARPTLDTTTVAYATTFPTIAAHSAVFETRRIAHTAATGASAPVYANVAVNSLHDWSAWVSDMTYLAFSWASDTHAAAMTPIMAVPLCLATDNGNPAPAYTAITAGTHDAVFTGLINAWKTNGFSTIYARIGYGGNDGTQPWDVGTDLTQAGQWIAAFKHVVTLFRAVSGITVKIIWNPAITGARPLSVDQIYPGDAFVDAIGLSVFNGVTQLDNYSWNLNDGSTFEPDFTTFLSHPINRAHYWNWPSGVLANPTGVAGDGSFGLGALVAYAQTHGKPICIPASGVGNIGDPSNANIATTGALWDDDAFPANLGTMLFGAGVPPCLFISAWDALTTRGDWTFSDPSYTGSMAKPNATAAWSSLFTTKAAVSDSVNLAWTAPVATVTGYNVQYKMSSVSTWSNAVPPSGTTPSVSIAGLAGATNYDFRVSATNVSGTGPFDTITAQAVP